MNDDPGFDVTMPGGLLPYHPTNIIYRAVLYEYWLTKDKTKVLRQAFLRRKPPKDRFGLSINPTENDCRDNPDLHEPIHGVVALLASEIRSIQKQDGTFLDVVPDTATHGNIKRVPYRDGIGNNDADATFISRRLAEFANSRAILQATT